MILSKDDRAIVDTIIAGEDELDNHPALYDKIYEHFVNSNEMPYGVAKARDGDPVQWITEHLDEV